VQVSFKKSLLSKNRIAMDKIFSEYMFLKQKLKAKFLQQLVMADPRKEKALLLAQQTQAAILSRVETVSSILRRCLTIAQLLEELSANQWIEFELNGYGKEHTTYGELGKIVPDYRQVKVFYYDIYDQPLMLDGNHKLAELFQKIPLGNPICDLEGGKTGLRVYGGHVDLLRKDFSAPAAYFLVSDVSVRRILEAVLNRSLSYVNQTVIDLEFGDVLSDIFDESRKVVNAQLAEICPTILENLTTIYDDLSTSALPHKWKQVAFACRNILIDFADSIYQPEYLPIGELPPKREDTKNKIRYVLLAKLSKSESNERKLLEAQIDYFERIVDYVNKHLHNYSNRTDAQKCVIHTYLIISDIVRFLR
jgi:hypothetical protein